jgi:exopolysaccharide production protein ExoZ
MPTLVLIQALRALAAILVVIFHANMMLGYWAGMTFLWLDRGAFGVDLFFVISGFIMTYISWGQFGASGASRDFLYRRLTRIVPLYWLITTVVVVMGHYPAWRVIGSYFFFWTGEQPVVNVGWTLDYEMLFYAIFAVGLTMPRVLGLCAIALALIVVHLFGGDFYGGGRTEQFTMGMGLAALYWAGVRIPMTAQALLLVSGLVWLALLPAGTSDWLTYGAIATAMMAAAVLGPVLVENKTTRGIVLLGDASYALYLIHLPIVRGVATALRDGATVNLAALAIPYIAIAVCCSIGVAIVLHLYVERPMLALFRRLLLRQATV